MLVPNSTSKLPVISFFEKKEPSEENRPDEAPLDTRFIADDAVKIVPTPSGFEGAVVVMVGVTGAICGMEEDDSDAVSILTNPPSMSPTTVEEGMIVLLEVVTTTPELDARFGREASRTTEGGDPKLIGILGSEKLGLRTRSLSEGDADLGKLDELSEEECS